MILSDNPSDEATHILDILPIIHRWWQEEKLQRNIVIFSSQYARQSLRPAINFKKIIKDNLP